MTAYPHPHAEDIALDLPDDCIVDLAAQMWMSELDPNDYDDLAAGLRLCGLDPVEFGLNEVVA